MFFLAIDARCRTAVASDVSEAQAREGLVFEQDIAPIFAAKCQRCHGAKVQKSALDLSSAEGIRRGGDSGPIVAAGDLEGSLLFDQVSQDLMPPDGEPNRLTKEEVQRIGAWIKAGARFASATTAGTQGKTDTLTQHDVLPALLLHCTVCHGLRRQEAGLDVRSKAAMLRGGKSGPAIVPGDPENSLLIKRIAHGEMPPPRRVVEVSVKPMPADRLEKLKAWIAQGAPEREDLPDVATTEPDNLVSDEDRDFWSFQPPRQVPTPAIDPSTGARTPLDVFILARLREQGLTLAGEADRLSLMRRACFDLTGLPPSPQEIATYLADTEPGAYERLIDRLLESPHYGERWARFWLDLAGYSDSEGKTNQDVIRTSAYRYRDYVIRAFNADKPYDRFLLEQLAGDELCDYEHAGEISTEIYDNLVATGFLRMTPDGTWANITNFVPDRLDVIADEIKVLGSAVMGLTLQCARCHTHKFDPLPQRDYYRLAAIFKPALDEHDWLGPKDRNLTQVTADESRLVEQHNSPLRARIEELQGALAARRDTLRNRILEERLANVAEELRAPLRQVFAVADDKRDEAQRKLAEDFRDTLTIDNQALQAADPDFKRFAERTTQGIGSLEKELKPLPTIRALWDRGEPSPTYLLRRGDYNSPGKLVGPGVPSMLTDGKTPFVIAPPRAGATSTGNRLALARWLTQPENPLTARVLVNRVWKQHFGRGIVTTLDNFGKTGARPSHPELLDWLARRFVEGGWSIKALHREMMTSATYRQTSAIDDERRKVDPGNHWFSRMPLRRAEAEVVRDSMLRSAGALDETQFGPPDAVDVRKDGLVTVRGTDHGWRRSIYSQQRRTEIPTLLENFDFPQMSPNCAERSASTVAPQALALMNNAWVHDLSRRFAERIVQDVGSDPSRQLEHAYLVALSRQPNAAERQVAEAALANLTAQWQREPGGSMLHLESVADLWIREQDPDKLWENDHISVWSPSAKERGRRYGLVEFDVRPLAGLDIHEVRLELGVLGHGFLRQTAACVSGGAEGRTWNSYQAEQAASAEPLDSLGHYDLSERQGETGKYLASAAASPRDIERLKTLAAAGNNLAIVMLPADDGGQYSRDWDDGVARGTRGNRPRLVVRYGTLPIEEAKLRALTNVCHALFNSAEFIYVD